MCNTREFGIHYSAIAQLVWLVLLNQDWDGDNTDKKSTSGFVFMLGYGPICWSSKKQTVLALSFAEAKY